MNVKKILIYIKLTGIGLFLLLILLFMLSNMQEVTVKFLGRDLWRVPMIAFMAIMACLGVTFYLFARKIGKLIKDFRALMTDKRTK